jgi:hypothetical protein
VALTVRKAELFPDNWIYIHDPSVKAGRVQNYRSWSPEMAPDGMSCLGLEYFCFAGDNLWDAPDSDLIALAKKEAAQIGLIAAADVADACMVRQPKAYPVYDEDYRDNVAAIRLDLEGRYPTLHLVGRNGMHKYNNQDHAMMTAMLTARNILAGERRYDVCGPSTKTPNITRSTPPARKARSTACGWSRRKSPTSARRRSCLSPLSREERTSQIGTATSAF